MTTVRWPRTPDARFSCLAYRACHYRPQFLTCVCYFSHTSLRISLSLVLTRENSWWQRVLVENTDPTSIIGLVNKNNNNQIDIKEIGMLETAMRGFMPRLILFSWGNLSGSLKSYLIVLTMSIICISLQSDNLKNTLDAHIKPYVARLRQMT